MSSVYKLLKKLEERKFLKSKISLSKNNVAQKVYSVTEQGKKIFKEKIKELVSKWLPSIHPVDVALKNLNLLDKKEAIECLKKYHNSLDETIDSYGKLEKYIIDNHGHLANVQLATRRIYLLKGEKKWLINFIEDFKNK